MTTDTELTAALRAFLEEGADRMPDRVYRGAMDQVPAARRRRTVDVPSALRWAAPLVRAGAAAALAVVIVVVGASFLSNGGQDRLDGSDAESPTPTPTLTPAPTRDADADRRIDRRAADRTPCWGLAPTRSAAHSRSRSAIALPDQTRLAGLDAGSVAFATPDGSASRPSLPSAVFPDPCQIDGEPVPVSTADEVIAALTGDVGIHGHVARRRRRSLGIQPGRSSSRTRSTPPPLDARGT